MRKVLGSFIFWFGIISLLIIYMNYRGQDEKNIALIGLNPILFKIVYIEPFRTWLNSGTVMRYFLGEPSATLNIYLAHLLTFLFYGLIIDLIKHGIKKIRSLIE